MKHWDRYFDGVPNIIRQFLGVWNFVHKIKNILSPGVSLTSWPLPKDIPTMWIITISLGYDGCQINDNVQLLGHWLIIMIGQLFNIYIQLTRYQLLYQFESLCWTFPALSITLRNFWWAVPTIHASVQLKSSWFHGYWFGIFCMSSTISLWCHFVTCHSEANIFLCSRPSLDFMFYEQH